MLFCHVVITVCARKFVMCTLIKINQSKISDEVLYEFHHAPMQISWYQFAAAAAAASAKF